MKATKYCPKCKIDKEKKHFGPNRAQHDGLQTWCRECSRKKDNRPWSANG